MGGSPFWYKLERTIQAIENYLPNFFLTKEFNYSLGVRIEHHPHFSKRSMTAFLPLSFLIFLGWSWSTINLWGTALDSTNFSWGTIFLFYMTILPLLIICIIFVVLHLSYIQVNGITRSAFFCKLNFWIWYTCGILNSW